MSNIKKRPKWNKHGVSEIIGNILILGITVTLFSSIMWFVTAMPTPQEHAYADMTSNLRMGYSTSTGGWANISITDKGGQELKSDATGIYIWINDTTLLRYKITDSRPGIGTSWTTGETWQVNITSATFPVGKDPNKAKISLMITDTVKNSEVYTVTLNGGGSLNNPSPPIIGARGTTPSPTYAGDPFAFYATVTDPNNDLNTNSVYLDASALNPSWGSLKMTDSNHDGVFTVNKDQAASPLVADLNWNGRIVIVNATDLSNHAATGRITLSILYKGGGTNQYGPYNNYSSYFVNGTYPPDSSGGEAGGPSGSMVGTTFYYIRDAVTNEITRVFAPQQKVMIEIYSTALTNLGLTNNFTMLQPLTGNPMMPPTKDGAFVYGGIFGTFYRYFYTFNAPDLGSPLVFPFQILLKDTMGTNINIVDHISIEGANYPQLQVLKGNLTSGNLENTNGNFYVTDRLYIRVLMKDVDTSMSTVVVGAIKVSDYSGRYIVNTLPSAFIPYTTQHAPNYGTPPISQLFKSNSTGIGRLADTAPGAGVAYTVYFIPVDAYQGWWLPNKNAYTLTVSTISDHGPPTGEIYYSLTTQINITAPASIDDIVASVGSGAYTWSATGASYDNNQILWYSATADRRDQWQTTTISGSTYNGPIGLATADIDNDGKKDVIVTYQDPSVGVAWFRNQKIDGSAWSTPYRIASGFDALPGQQTAGGSAYPNGGSTNGNRDEDTSLYANYYSSYEPDGAGTHTGTYYSVNEIAEAMATGDLNGDGQTDIVVSYTHVVIFNDATSNNGADSPTHNFPMFFNRGVYVYWGPNWQKTQLYGTNTWIAANTSNSNSNGAVMDLAAGDFNKDGYDDIVGVYENGTTAVWLSQAASAAGDNTKVFGAGSFIRIAPTVPGTTPWLHVGKTVRVRAADMDGNGYPDIIRTSSSSNEVAVFYTTPIAGGGFDWYPNKEFATGPGITGSAKGTMANLISVDNKWENLTEVNWNYPMDKEVPDQPGVNNTQGQNIAYLASDTDGQNYNVAPTQTMYIASFLANNSYQTKQLSSAVLRVKFTADSSYSGTAAILYSLNNGVTFASTGIVPKNWHTNYIATFDLLAHGANTWAALRSLDVNFLNNGGGSGTILFDSMWIEAYYVNTTVLDWTWVIPNDPTQPLELLTMNYKCLGINESFQLQYSPDNTTWFDLTTLASTTQQTVNFNLDYTTNSVYYVRVTDNNHGTTDTARNTLCVNYLGIKEYSPKVTWSNSAGVGGKIEKYLSDLPAGNYVTSIAVGDIGSQWSLNHKPDGLPDIVVGTTEMASGAGGARYTVYVFAQNAGSSDFTQVPVYTPNIAANVADGSYQTVQVQIGDFNGDGIPDILVVLGFQKGVTTGTAPTLWLIENNPQPGSWQFSDQPINVLSANQGAINAIPANIGLTVLLPFVGLIGLIVAEAVADGRKKKR